MIAPGRAAPAGAEDPGAPFPDAAEAALQGDLGRFPAADVLQFLRLAGASGRLEIEHGGERVAVGFADGRPVWARTTGRSVRLGDVLLRRGWASRDDLDAALDEQRRRPAELLGRLLRSRGIAEEHVAAAARDVFRRLVCLLSLWPEGRFRFVPGREQGADDDSGLELEMERLILEGLHQADLASGAA